MYFLIGADFVPTKSNIDDFVTGKVDALIGNELLNVLEAANYRMFNLETPLTDHITPIRKNGPNLLAPTSAVMGYKTINVNLLTLANNHILDQGLYGLSSTINTLQQNRIDIVGVGSNISEACKPFYFDFCGHRIGVYACVEHEFSVATESKPGANPFDPLCSYDHISNMKEECDYIIVLYHGGKEYYRYPSPMLQRVCRRFIDKGANIVVCQHSHCVGCEEKYEKGTIVYGQGNFLFDLNDDEYWGTGLLLKIDEELTVSYVPIKKNKSAVNLASQAESNYIMNSFYARSEEIKQKVFVEESFKTFADNCLVFYLEAFKGKNSIPFRIINKITKGKLLKKTLKDRYTDTNRISLINYIDCEAHREVLLQALIDSFERR